MGWTGGLWLRRLWVEKEERKRVRWKRTLNVRGDLTQVGFVYARDGTHSVSSVTYNPLGP